MVPGPYFGRFDDQSGASASKDFGTNGLDTAVLLASKALKYINIAVEWK